MEYFAFFIVVFLGAFIQGSTGFGFGIFCMAILPFFMPFKVVTVVVLLSSLVVIIRLAYTMRKHLNLSTAKAAGF